MSVTSVTSAVTYLDMLEAEIIAAVDQLADLALDEEGEDQAAWALAMTVLKAKLCTQLRQTVAADPRLRELLLRKENITF